MDMSFVWIKVGPGVLNLWHDTVNGWLFVGWVGGTAVCSLVGVKVLYTITIII